MSRSCLGSLISSTLTFLFRTALMWLPGIAYERHRYETYLRDVQNPCPKSCTHHLYNPGYFHDRGGDSRRCPYHQRKAQQLISKTTRDKVDRPTQSQSRDFSQDQQLSHNEIEDQIRLNRFERPSPTRRNGTRHIPASYTPTPTEIQKLMSDQMSDIKDLDNIHDWLAENELQLEDFPVTSDRVWCLQIRIRERRRLYARRLSRLMRTRLLEIDREGLRVALWAAR